MAIMTVKQRKFAPTVLLRSHLRLRERRRKAKKPKAITLIEVMVATAILVIVATGALSYQYHAARDAQIARAQIAATRTAQLLLEDWMSTGGSEEYNPATLGLGFSSALSIPSHFSQGKGQGLGSPLHDAVYAITVDKLPMLVMLKWKDVAQDTGADVILRQLDVIVNFGVVSREEETVITKQLENIKPVILTTYVRVDAAGG